LARSPAAGVQGEKTIDKRAELGDLVWAAVKLLMAKPRAVQKPIYDGYAVIPGFDEVVRSGNGGHGKF
jgi:hypothetical protein